MVDGMIYFVHTASCNLGPKPLASGNGRDGGRFSGIGLGAKPVSADAITVLRPATPSGRSGRRRARLPWPAEPPDPAASLKSVRSGANGIEVVGEAADGGEVPAAVDAHAPDVMLMVLSPAIMRRLMDQAVAESGARA